MARIAAAEGTSRVASSLRKKRPARVLLAAVIFILFYFILFPYPLGREMVAHPRWAVSIPAAAGPADGDAARPAWQFQLGDRFGYVRGDGSVTYAAAAPYRVALSATAFVNYSRLGTDWILQDFTGRRLASFSGSGYPLLGPDGSRVFSVKTDLSGIIELDRAGGVLWERDFPALMTSAAIQGDTLVVGLLNGSLLVIDRQGAPVSEYSAPGSRIPVVLGTAVAPDGSLVAALTGIGPQNLTIVRRQNPGYLAAAVLGLPSDFRREVRMGFSPDSRFLFLEGRDGAGLLDPGSMTLTWVTLPGRFSGAAFPGHGRFAALASRDGAMARILIQPPAGIAVSREDFPARELSVETVDGQLLLGWDGRLLRIDVEAL
jgi:hypothetical protein